MLRTEVSKEAKISDTMVLLRLFNYQGALTVRYHRQCSFYRRRLFAAYHITDISEKDFGKISDGQKQRVMLARAICQEPEIVILDEPTSYLDIKYKLEFLLLLQEMREKKGLTVIMSLHELELAKIVSDKILCLKGEYVERYGTPEEIFESDFIERLYDMNEKDFIGNEKLLAYMKQISNSER